ncbi:RNA polymerase sigma factor [Fusibacter ferrireducens]|uniref:Sigma-70 family RNA polymerase sigma factor n=1 Tax=Fusibacter ferrireducens TaxID=2785058 RepID=A0ABR9ZNJ6_9FIRM|nr:sigma-70 family RNA polymerase sigma factor [Fusibacter ferrireducens]MBF4692009.1 sigma-70 family RNA polymerase sigma factor [Fusibacter ferrireducens]
MYHLYSKELFAISNSILNDPHEAEDVVQSAFIKVTPYIHKNLDVKCNKTRGLIVIIVKNLSFNVYSRRKLYNMANIQELENVLEDNDDFSPESVVLRLDQNKEIAQKLALVKEEYAEIMTLKYVHELTNTEISELLSITESSVRSKLHRAKKALQKILGGVDYERE